MESGLLTVIDALWTNGFVCCMMVLDNIEESDSFLNMLMEKKGLN